MNKRRVRVSILSMLLLLTLAMGLVSAQGPVDDEPDNVGDVTLSSAVASRITYQGVLRSSGQPVTGTRDMIFRLYTNSTCASQVGADIVKNGVQVTNGLFSVTLDVTPSTFDGQALWVKAFIAGTGLGCQEILPVPYALSLRPGARIGGTNAGSGTLSLYDIDGEEMIRLSAADGFVTIGGAGDDGDLIVKNTSDVTTFSVNGASGTVLSFADTEISVNPLNLRLNTASDAVLDPNPAGYMVIDPNIMADLAAYVPVDLPLRLLGSPLKLKAVRVCYDLGNSASYITETSVRMLSDMGIGTDIILDSTDRTSAAWQCYTITDATPATLEGSLMVRFIFHATNLAHVVNIGNITLTLTEQ